MTDDDHRDAAKGEEAANRSTDRASPVVEEGGDQTNTTVGKVRVT